MKHPKSLLIFLVFAGLVLGACTDSGGGTETGGETAQQPSESNPEGITVKIAFSAPGADHGWLAAITENARTEAESWEDVELILTEGTNDSAAQASQVETLVSQDPDVLVILPHEGDALTPAAQAAMDAGVPVINLDREFSSPSAYRTWIGGDNYGIGQSAGQFFADELGCQGNVVEIQGIAGISVTELRTQGFEDAIAQCDGGIEVIAQQPADFLPDKGLEVMEAILQSEDQIDAVYTHDDDMAMGVVAAIQNAGREDEMFVTGAGGSNDAMDLIAEGGLYRATFLYNPSMSASAIRLARLIALGEGLDALVEPEVPSYIQLPASTVTQDNVESFRDLGY
ncbi:MAG: substrate-binding domain-containing protein [Actinomycetota bacterium]